MSVWIAYVALVAAAQDGDADGVSDAVDVCPLQADPTQPDGDGDGAGDACDLCRSPGDGTALFGPLVDLGVASDLPPLPADLDADGDLDVILAVFGSIDWMENTGAGSFADPVALVTTGWWQVGALAVADLDDDSLPDLIASEESGFGLVYFAGQGAGSFAAEALIDADHTGGVLAADLDGDGDDDLSRAPTRRPPTAMPTASPMAKSSSSTTHTRGSPTPTTVARATETRSRTGRTLGTPPTIEPR